MQTIRNLVRMDIMHLQGNKHRLTRQFLFYTLIAAALCFIWPPLIIIEQIVLAAMLPGDLEKCTAETANGCGILPVSRRDIVTARYLLLCGYLTLISLVMLMLAAVCSYFSVWQILTPDEDMTDVFQAMFGLRGSAVSGNLIAVCFGYMAAMILLAVLLRSSFRHFGEHAAAPDTKQTLRKWLIPVACYFGLGLLIIITGKAGSAMTGVGSVLSLLFAMVTSLSLALNGLMLCLIMVTTGVSAAVYRWFCTVQEFAQHEF